MDCILVLDSDAMLRALLEECLAGEGYRVMSQTPDAVTPERVAQLHPDLILLDGPAPWDRAGWGLLEGLCADPTTEAIPLVLCAPKTPQVIGRVPWLVEH